MALAGTLGRGLLLGRRWMGCLCMAERWRASGRSHHLLTPLWVSPHHRSADDLEL